MKNGALVERRTEKTVTLPFTLLPTSKER